MTITPLTTPVLAAGAVDAAELLRFWTALGVLLLAARTCGRLARRAGQPAVVGELAAGVLLGPTLLGRIAPDVTAWLFPAEGDVAAMIAAIAWLGVVLLLAVTGFEVDLHALRSLGRAAVTTSTASLLIPIAMGLALGLALPASFAGPAGDGALPLFMGVALGISALPVVAKVLRELQLAKAGVGQIMLAAGMINDVVGWALLGVVAGVVTSSGSPLQGLATALTGAVAVIIGGLTIGQRAVDALLRRVRRREEDRSALLGVAVILIVGAGAVTQALGVEAVLGAFVAGVVLARSPLGGKQIERPLAQVADHVLAPVFFATAGLQVDLLSILRPPTLWWTLAIIAVAVVGKVLGGWIGARLGGFGNRDGLAIGIGLNARGALEIVVASVGLSLGVLSGEAYSAVVVMAVVTSLMAPPLLTAVLGLRDRAADAEGGTSAFADVRTALLPTRGGASSVLAGRVVDAVLPTGAALIALSVHPDRGDAQAGRAAARSLATHVTRKLRWRDHVADDAAEEILAESVLGYDLLAVGATASPDGSGAASRALRRIVEGSAVPVLLVRAAPTLDPAQASFGTVAVGVTGSETSTPAAELAIRLASRTGAGVDLLHAVAGPVSPPAPGPRDVRVEPRAASDVLRAARAQAEHAGVAVRERVLHRRHAGEALVEAACRTKADLLVVGAERRADGVFLGPTATHLLEHAPMSVAVLVTARREDGH